jgi:hypothetical protein
VAMLRWSVGTTGISSTSPLTRFTSLSASASSFTLDQPSLLFAVSKDCKWAVFVPGEIVLQCPVKMLDNKFCFQEPFFVVPIEYCMLVDLEKKPDGVKTPPGQPCDSGGED